MIPAIYNWQPCRVCGLPVPAGETAHRECSERTDEPGELAAHLADAGEVAAKLYCWMCGATLTDEEAQHVNPDDPDSIICRHCAGVPLDW